ncbi:NAD(P)/FAD-dependent oxidoreductase [Capillimicrobium parvum]|uniref:Gamma-glutamylputrescine oxidoreductase n=1 Tax=Capillimicrobium parvum TaxID=2884022 RepID=A0A9E7BZQ6_9ACTN|nr:FAD-dependent oxidoreductase [Capillimicrobium parvum]UGS35625.1 Gamma-glutamylputrescine oxidoreductase [Capillimicrobium parvum]
MSPAVRTPPDVSHWMARIDAAEPIRRRPALTGVVHADVCIVGAGYTGLWAAYALKQAAPDLDVVIVEAEFAGYGASGRNGGAAVAQVSGSREYWARIGGREGVVAFERALRDAVAEMGAAIAREGIDCGFVEHGSLHVARTTLELARQRAAVEADRAWGVGPEHTLLLDAGEVRDRLVVAGALGARLNRRCATLDPGRLVRGLAAAAERSGARIFEGSRVRTIAPGRAATDGGEVRARFVLQATDAYSGGLAHSRRTIVPVHTSMLVTEPLSTELWAELGWQGRESVACEHPFVHLQRTTDGRITIGGDDNRIPYRFGSRPPRDAAATDRVRRTYHEELLRAFPQLQGVRVERSWQGIFGASRDWAPSVWLDRATGLGWAGGYVGEGVAASNLAGRTLSDLVLDRRTDLVSLPWVRPFPRRRWEPEPLRTIGAAGIWAMRAIGERAEGRSGRPSRLVEVGNRIAGFTGNAG